MSNFKVLINQSFSLEKSLFMVAQSVHSFQKHFLASSVLEARNVRWKRGNVSGINKHSVPPQLFTQSARTGK